MFTLNVYLSKLLNLLFSSPISKFILRNLWPISTRLRLRPGNKIRRLNSELIQELSSFTRDPKKNCSEFFRMTHRRAPCKTVCFYNVCGFFLFSKYLLPPKKNVIIEESRSSLNVILTTPPSLFACSLIYYVIFDMSNSFKLVSILCLLFFHTIFIRCSSGFW